MVEQCNSRWPFRPSPDTISRYYSLNGSGHLKDTEDSTEDIGDKICKGLIQCIYLLQNHQRYLFGQKEDVRFIDRQSVIPNEIERTVRYFLRIPERSNEYNQFISSLRRDLYSWASQNPNQADKMNLRIDTNGNLVIPYNSSPVTKTAR